MALSSNPTEAFSKLQLREELIEKRLQHYNYLNSGLKLIYNGKTFIPEKAFWI